MHDRNALVHELQCVTRSMSTNELQTENFLAPSYSSPFHLYKLYILFNIFWITSWDTVALCVLGANGRK